MIKAGVYRGRAVKGSEKRGESPSGKPEMNLNLKFDAGAPEGVVECTTTLYFSTEAAPHSIARLRQCGWTGSDLSETLEGVDANEIDITVSYSQYEGREVMKVQIGAGNGQYQTKKPATDNKAWAAAVAVGTGLPVGPKNAPKPGF